MNRRDCLKGLIASVGSLLSKPFRASLPDPEPETIRMITLHPRYAFEYEIPEELEPWFLECSRLIFAETTRLQIPMGEREIRVYFPTTVTDLPFINRITADWYDGGKRYGFRVCWPELRSWPEPQEILEAARSLLRDWESIEIDLRTRWLDGDRSVVLEWRYH